MLYHISQTPGLETLKPHQSTHGKAYVYAIENLVAGLLFGVKQDDFDFIIDIGEDGIPVIFECYPNAFQTIYREKSCSIYEVEESGFQKGMTSWSPELVCEYEVPVVREVVVSDLYQRLREAESAGRLFIHRYEFCEAYRQKIANHIVDRIFRFDLDLHTCPEQDERFATHYFGIVQALLAVLDGHLLK